MSLGAEAIKTAALFFHKQDPHEENQLVPFAAYIAALLMLRAGSSGCSVA